MNQVETTLRKAAQLIRKHGWTRHTFEDDRGRFCLLGAVRKALVPHARTDELPSGKFSLYSRCYKQLKDVTGPDIAVAGFNDYVAQDADDIVAVLDIAADLAA